jgi:hypothetical protein
MKHIVLTIFLLAFILFLLGGCKKGDSSTANFCDKDSDCAPASCCHADSCTNQRPDCENIMCTLDCKPGTMDCGQGKCVCQNNECVAVIS